MPVTQTEQNLKKSCRSTKLPMFVTLKLQYGIEKILSLTSILH
jgi:hypothetical protein